MEKKIPNELSREFLGVVGLNPWISHDSSSRVQMFSSHIGQALVVKGSTIRRCQTGMEREFGKYTFSTKIPADAQIIKIVERYKRTYMYDSIAFNPQTLIIYEEVETKRIGCISLQNHCSYHQYFGFEYKNTPELSKLRVGQYVQGGTVLQDSPSITPDKNYKYGVECNMAFMTHPAVAEDGVMISRDVLDKFAFKTYETRVVEFGNKRFPLNLYGDKDNYKPFPDIGDRIREDGILMGLRTYSDTLSVVEQSAEDLMQVDFVHDRLVYAGGAGGRVIDIRVQHERDNPQAGTPVGMEEQATKYDTARRQFYQEILDEHNRLRHERGQNLHLTPEFQRMVVEAISVVGETRDKKRVMKLYRQAPLDDWRIEFVVEYEITPTIGFKLTETHGGKGVICKIAEPHEMPVDEDGNRADIVMDPNSTMSRMNLGRLYEQYINAASRDVAKQIVQRLGFKGQEPESLPPAVVLSTLESVEKQTPELLDTVWNYLLGYYQIVSPKMYIWFTTGQYKGTRLDHLAAVVRDGIYLYIPPESEVEMSEVVQQLERQYRPTYGPVTYVGNSGQKITTKSPVRIGSLYVILLEKIGDDWTAVSSAKLQHYGVLSQVTNADKYSQPTRNQAIRALGEAEVRIYVSYVGSKTTADILDRNANPVTHEEALKTLLTSDKPTNITQLVDRNKTPMGGSKPLQLVRHIAECGGWRFCHIPDTNS